MARRVLAAMRIWDGAIRWYLRGLIHPLLYLVTLLTILSIHPFRGNPVRLTNALATSADLFFLPLILFMLSLHLVRDTRVTVFEISVFRSYFITYTARIISFMLGYLAVTTPLIIYVCAVGAPLETCEAIVLKGLTASGILGVALAGGERRDALLYLAVFYMLLPFGVPVIFEKYASAHAKLPLPFAVLACLVTPLVTYARRTLLPIAYNDVMLLSLVVAALLVAAGLAAFRYREYGV